MLRDIAPYFCIRICDLPKALYSFDIVDKTLPLYGTEALRRDMTVVGDVFRQLLPILENGTEEERLLAARAFREALAALENREIDA